LPSLPAGPLPLIPRAWVRPTLFSARITSWESPFEHLGAVLGLVAFGRRSSYDLARLTANPIEHLLTPSQSEIDNKVLRSGDGVHVGPLVQRMPDKQSIMTIDLA
jgi:hypothetical protein